MSFEFHFLHSNDREDLENIPRQRRRTMVENIQLRSQGACSLKKPFAGANTQLSVGNFSYLTDSNGGCQLCP